MILLTRLNGSQIGINPDLIERVDSSGDTVVSLIDATKYVVAESPADVVELIIEFRGRVLAEADRALHDGAGRAGLRLIVEQEPGRGAEPDADSPAVTPTPLTHDRS